MEGPDPDIDDIFLGDSDSEDEFEEGSFSKPKPLFLLNLALERSPNHPLDVTLDFGSSDADSDEENGPATQMRRMGLRDSSTSTLHSDLIRAVVAHSDRWRTAEELQITDALITRFAPIRNRLVLLTKLAVSIFTFAGTTRAFLYPKNAPQLTDVTLNPHDQITSPWSALHQPVERPPPFLGDTPTPARPSPPREPDHHMPETIARQPTPRIPRGGIPVASPLGLPPRPPTPPPP
ncbi:hypothetical protein B0H17DRAFT_1330889 [Mycena rosella]|uniref:Uncharacterized protein n=1 Tax=Mycena rosella TaxID=1033263 RepID=A0AAD7DHY4_MYCRO|nr:hypothetical protein B0H17DRAFT_1330889 [Mycena rosella]